MAFTGKEPWYKFFTKNNIEEMAREMIKEIPCCVFYEGNTSVYGIFIKPGWPARTDGSIDMAEKPGPNDCHIFVYRIADKGNVGMGGTKRGKIIMSTLEPRQLVSDIQNGIHYVTTSTK